MTQPLENIRILDFGRVLSAPYGTMILADLGADVVKVEPPKGGDDTRAFGPPFVQGVSAYFLSINRGKRSIVLDLKTPSGIETAKSLALQADVLVENFRPGVMDSLGLGATELIEANPRLIYASLTGFGRHSGNQPGYDLLVQGLSGIPSLTGPIEGDPYKCPASIADLTAGLNLVQGVLAALFRREKTGAGGVVDVSMNDGMLSLLTYHAGSYLNAGVEPRRRGNEHPSIHPFQPYAVLDGHLNICIGNDRLFEKLCAAMGYPEWSEDPRFSSNPQRVAHRDSLNKLLEPIFLLKSKSEWIDVLTSAGVPAAGMNSVAQALEAATIIERPHPDGSSTFKSLGLPFKIDDLPTAASKGAPGLNADKKSILWDWLGEDA